MRLIIAVAVFACLFINCKKSSSHIDGNHQFVFGITYGYCMGDCAHFYALDSGKLYADDVPGQYTGTLAFKTEALPNDKYLLAKQLVDSFPAFLLNNKDTTYGCPDCSDGGAVHIWCNVNGKVRYWNIDNMNERNPAEIQTYILKLQNVMHKL